jgi:hypothetical protein
LLYFFLGITDPGKSGAGLVDFVSSLDIPVNGQYCMSLTESMHSNSPTGTTRDGGKECKDHHWNQKLEYDDHLPVPLAQTGSMLGAAEVDPEADE